MAAFGIETHVHITLTRRTGAFHLIFQIVVPRKTPIGIIPLLGRAVKNGYHPREDAAAVEIEHIFRIGAHLVISRTEWQLRQREVPVTAALVYGQHASLDNHASRVQQLDIERTAQHLGPVVKGRNHVCRKPYIVAMIIARIVEVKVDLLLRHHVAKAVQVFGNTHKPHYGAVLRHLLPRCRRDAQHTDNCQNTILHIHKPFTDTRHRAATQTDPNEKGRRDDPPA